MDSAALDNSERGLPVTKTLSEVNGRENRSPQWQVFLSAFCCLPISWRCCIRHVEALYGWTHRNTDAFRWRSSMLDHARMEDHFFSISSPASGEDTLSHTNQQSQSTCAEQHTSRLRRPGMRSTCGVFSRRRDVRRSAHRTASEDIRHGKDTWPVEVARRGRTSARSLRPREPEPLSEKRRSTGGGEKTGHRSSADVCIVRKRHRTT